MRLRSFVSSVLVLLPTVTAAKPSPQPLPSAVPVVALSDIPSLAWEERQFVQADKQGRVFLLRGGTLELFAVTSSGGLEPKGRLGDSSPERTDLSIESAALSPGGDLWVLFSKPNRLDVFQFNKRRESIDAPWLVSSVAAPGGEPVVSTLPATIDAATVSARPEPPPALARWDGKRWSTLLEGSFGRRSRTGADAAGAIPGVSWMEQLRGEFSLLLAPTPDGGLWAADRYAYRLRSFSPLGAVKDEVRVGKGEVQWSERSAEEWKQVEALAKREGLPFDRRSLSKMRATEVVRAMTAGRDGALYLLVQAEEGLALDRFDPALLHLERVRLTGLDPVPGRLTLAAGRDGLYLAAPSGRLGLWRIAVEALEEADWKPVPGASFDGHPIEPLRTAAGSLPVKPPAPVRPR